MESPAIALGRSSRVRAYEIAVWVISLAAGLAMPRYAPLFNEIAILALFAV